jgi:cytochrome P450
MSGIFVHNSEEIFRDALKFDPDRWLNPDSRELEKWLVAFSKGPRSCLGQKYVYMLPPRSRTLVINLHSLAYCELYLMFAALFRRFDMQLDGTRLVKAPRPPNPVFYLEHAIGWKI